MLVMRAEQMEVFRSGRTRSVPRPTWSGTLPQFPLLLFQAVGEGQLRKAARLGIGARGQLWLHLPRSRPASDLELIRSCSAAISTPTQQYPWAAQVLADRDPRPPDGPCREPLPQRAWTTEKSVAGPQRRLHPRSASGTSLVLAKQPLTLPIEDFPAAMLPRDRAGLPGEGRLCRRPGCLGAHSQGDGMARGCSGFSTPRGMALVILSDVRDGPRLRLRPPLSVDRPNLERQGGHGSRRQGEAIGKRRR